MKAPEHTAEKYSNWSQHLQRTPYEDYGTTNWSTSRLRRAHHLHINIWRVATTWRQLAAKWYSRISFEAPDVSEIVGASPPSSLWSPSSRGTAEFKNPSCRLGPHYQEDLQPRKQLGDKMEEWRSSSFEAEFCFCFCFPPVRAEGVGLSSLDNGPDGKDLL